MTLTIGSLFSGIGGLELGLEWAGVGHTVWQVEKDAWCRGVLAKHWPNAKRYGDVRTVGAAQLERVDVICGGFPCQGFSNAGKRAGLDDARSGLWREYARIVRELRPRFVVIENVAALVARGLDVIVADLDAAGYDVDARIIAAADVGAPHKRERLFVVANARSARPQGADQREPELAELAGCGDVAHPDRERVRLEQQRRPGGRARGVRHEGQGEPLDDGPQGGRHPEPRVGRDAHGPAHRVERWPSRPGDAPAVWEPSRARRVTTPTTARRLHSLGNAVVPQVSAEAGRFIVARWLSSAKVPV